MRLLLFFSLLLLLMTNLPAAEPTKPLCLVDCLAFKDNSTKLKKCSDECLAQNPNKNPPKLENVEKIFSGESCVIDCEKNRLNDKNVAAISCAQMCQNYKNQNPKESVNTTVTKNLVGCTLSSDDTTINCPFGEYKKTGTPLVAKDTSSKIRTEAIGETRQSYFIITILLFAIIVISAAYFRK